MKDEAKVSANAFDFVSGSGIAKIEYQVVASGSSLGEDWITEAPTLTANTIASIYIKLTDVAGNTTLTQAKITKNDEFYTQLSDIENELKQKLLEISTKENILDLML